MFLGGPICLLGPSSGFLLLLHYAWFRLVFGELNSWVVHNQDTWNESFQVF